jgi:hypothetical protein
MGILDLPLISRTRRTHALEHATIHVLNRRFPMLQIAGWSTHRAFYISGAISAADVDAAVTEALLRLRRGESQLAIHPLCGTNLVTAGSLVGLITFLTMLPGDARSRRQRLPTVLLLSTLAMVIAQPLGLLVQEHVTTETNVAQTQVTRIDSRPVGQVWVHCVQLRQEGEA